MLVLGIETATRFGSVALVRGTGRRESEVEVLAADVRDSGRTHGAMLLEQIDVVLGAAGLDMGAVEAFAVSSGPGSFTGLRVGMATAKALAWASGVPAVAVPTLEAWAMHAAASGIAGAGATLGVILDARKQEVYSAMFRLVDGVPERVRADTVESPQASAAALRESAGSGGEMVLLGDGPGRYAEPFAGIAEGARTDLAELPPSGAGVATLGMAQLIAHGPADVRDLAPVYVRQSEAELNLARKSNSVD